MTTETRFWIWYFNGTLNAVCLGLRLFTSDTGWVIFHLCFMVLCALCALAYRLNDQNWRLEKLVAFLCGTGLVSRAKTASVMEMTLIDFKERYDPVIDARLEKELS